MRLVFLSIIAITLANLGQFVVPLVHANSDERHRINRLYNEAAKGFERLENDANYRQSLENWEKVIARFSRITSGYPRSISAVKSYYNIGILYRRLYRLNRQQRFIEGSNAAFETLHKSYPISYLADDALLALAQNYKNGSPEQRGTAGELLRELLSTYPNSELRGEAKQMLSELGKTATTKAPKNTTKPKRAKASTLYKRAAADYYRLYEEDSFRKYEHNWTNTITKFQEILKAYPQSKEAAKSLYNIGVLYKSLYTVNRQSRFIEQSNAHFRRLVQDFPRSSLADDAQSELARSYDTLLKDTQGAQNAYQELIRRFPKSPQAQGARKRITEITAAQQSRTQGKTTAQQGTPTQKNTAESRVAITPPSEEYLSAARDQPTAIERVKHSSSQDFTRIVLISRYPHRFRYQTLSARGEKGLPRFYVDLLNAFLPPNFSPNIATNDGIINRLRVAQFDPSTVRLVLELANYQRINIFTTFSEDRYRLIIDVLGKKGEKWGYGLREGAPKNKAPTHSHADGAVHTPDHQGRQGHNHNTVDPSKSTLPTKDIAKTVDQKQKTSLSSALGLKVRTVIIDPGHGGKDPGATSGTVLEKHIALKLAHALKKIFARQDKGLRVLLTRSKDNFIPLEERTAFANKNRGDLFISIHINAAVSSKVHGIETYFLNITNDQDSLLLASKENTTTLLGNNQLESIIQSMMTGARLQESAALAESVQEALVQQTSIYRKSKRVRNIGVKQAPFIVLIGAEMPSVLVEVGFLSNRTERRYLTTDSYLEAVAKGIYHGIAQYRRRVATGFVGL